MNMAKKNYYINLVGNDLYDLFHDLLHISACNWAYLAVMFSIGLQHMPCLAEYFRVQDAKVFWLKWNIIHDVSPEPQVRPPTLDKEHVLCYFIFSQVHFVILEDTLGE